jgi:hypothetical protein
MKHNLITLATLYMALFNIFVVHSKSLLSIKTRKHLSQLSIGLRTSKQLVSILRLGKEISSLVLVLRLTVLV